MKLGELRAVNEGESHEVYDQCDRCVATFWHFEVGAEMADRYAKMLVSVVKRNKKRSRLERAEAKLVETIAPKELNS